MITFSSRRDWTNSKPAWENPCASIGRRVVAEVFWHTGGERQMTAVLETNGLGGSEPRANWI
jgi:hypothetical protein